MLIPADLPADAELPRHGIDKHGVADMMYGWTDMAGYGLGHWLVFAIMVAVFLYPVGRILSRIGFSPFWSILAFIPLVNLIGLWVLALVDWPRGDASAQSAYPSRAP